MKDRKARHVFLVMLRVISWVLSNDTTSYVYAYVYIVHAEKKHHVHDATTYDKQEWHGKAGQRMSRPCQKSEQF